MLRGKLWETFPTPQITSLLKQMSISLENQRRNQKDYPLVDAFPKNAETYALGLLIGKGYYNENLLDERKKI